MHITDNARKAWRHVTRLLDRMGVLTEADGVAVESLCEAYADVLNARAELKAFGSNYYKTTGKDGGVMHRVHPAVAVMQDADRRLKGWLAEFGLTASSRTRVHADPGRARTAADEYLDGPTVDRFFR